MGVSMSISRGIFCEGREGVVEIVEGEKASGRGQALLLFHGE